jgi:hypothetical protein
MRKIVCVNCKCQSHCKIKGNDDRPQQENADWCYIAKPIKSKHYCSKLTSITGRLAP